MSSLLQVANGDANGMPQAADMRQLTWNDDLAEVAQRWADQCIFEHDDGAARYLLNRSNPEMVACKYLSFKCFAGLFLVLRPSARTSTCKRSALSRPGSPRRPCPRLSRVGTTRSTISARTRLIHTSLTTRLDIILSWHGPTRQRYVNVNDTDTDPNYFVSRLDAVGPLIKTAIGIFAWLSATMAKEAIGSVDQCTSRGHPVPPALTELPASMALCAVNPVYPEPEVIQM